MNKLGLAATAYHEKYHPGKQGIKQSTQITKPSNLEKSVNYLKALKKKLLETKPKKVAQKPIIPHAAPAELVKRKNDTEEFDKTLAAHFDIEF